MQTATAADLIQRARYASDTETATAAEDFVTDTEALTYLSNAYRRLRDHIIDCGGADLLLTSATLSAPSYTLPSDFYRAAALDLYLSTNTWRTLHRFNFAERNRRWLSDATFPLWRIVNGTLLFEPPGATPTTLRLWYIQDFSMVSSTASVIQTFGGWDDYLIADIAMQMLMKEERDLSVQGSLFKAASDRIRTAVRQLVVIDGEQAAKTEVMPAEVEDALLFAYDI